MKKGVVMLFSGLNAGGSGFLYIMAEDVYPDGNRGGLN
ncbi:MAG: hypothetical protein RJA20_1073 [Bacteroidota bacterium]|jgi:hypothetical protein